MARVFGQAPVITSFSPATGPAGTSVTITGTGFAPVAVKNVVFFGATMATVTTASTNSLTVTVPKGATYEPISVLNGNTALIGNSAKPFITTFTPNKGNITTDDFTPPVAFNTGGNCTGITISDIDGDGKPDLVMANTGGSALSVLRNISTSGSITSASFAPKVDFASVGSVYQIAAGDIDGDGKPDVVICSQGTVANPTNKVSIFRNTSTVGSVSFATRVDLVDDNPIDVAIADLDGDGKPEIVAVEEFNNTVSIWPNTSIVGSITGTSFGNRISIGLSNGTDSRHTSIAIGDLDGDDKPDIVVNNAISNTISVLRNNLTGSLTGAVQPFDPTVDFFTGGHGLGDDAIVVKIGDLDGDGKPDIVASNYSPNLSTSISILRNTSTPGAINANSFAPEVEIPCSHPWGIAIGDMDGDGKPDLAIVNADDNMVSVFRNISVPGSINGESFAPAAKFVAATRGPQFIAIDDLDGDGKADIAVNGFTSGTGSNNNIYVLRNNPLFPPDVQATNIVFSNIAANSTTVTWTNGNGAGRAVFISAASTGSALPVSGSNYTANPAFGFGTQIGTSGWYCIYKGTSSSVDISGLSPGVSYRVMVAEYTGTPGAENYLITTATGNPANVTTVADTDLPPIVTSFTPVTGLLGSSATITGLNFAPTAANNTVFFGATRANVTAGNTTSLTVNIPAGATYQPISVLNTNTALTGYSQLPFVTTFTPNKGSIAVTDFLPPVTFNTGAEQPSDIVLTDIDGDGKPDIVVVNYFLNTISVLRNISVNGSITSASFAPKVDFATGNSPGAIVVTDLDGDGKPDIAVVNSPDNTISVFRNTSTAGSITVGSFAPPVTFATLTGPGELRTGDIDGDGKPDLVLVSSVYTDPYNTNTYTNTISILRNTSVRGSITAGSFAPAVAIFAGNGTDAEDLTIGDVDGDGKPDIAVSLYILGKVAIFRNTSTIGSINSTGSFAAPVYFITGSGLPLPFSLTMGDLDGDGKPELVVTNLGNANMSVFRNTSTSGSIDASSYAAPVAFAVPYNNLGFSAIGDLDGDGKPDIAVVSYDVNETIAVFRNTSTMGSITAGSFAPRIDVPVGLPVDRIKIGDLDGDGRADLIAGLGEASGSTIAILRNAPFFPPTIQATNIIFSNTGTNSTTATWTNGNGTARAVFISAATTGSPLPVNRTAYAANSFYGSGTQVGSSGWICIYNGTGNTVNITGLSSGATYRVMVVEYNGSPGSENYLTTPATGNPANVTTLTGGPITINSINLVTASLTNANSVQYAVTFAASVTGVTANDFALAATGGISGANITSVTGSGSTYIVTVNTGTGNGTIGLNLANTGGLAPGIVSPLPFVGQIYTIDRIAPAITISSPSVNNMLSGAGTVTYTVTYTDPNFNASSLTAANITLNSNGSATGTVSVSGSGTTYTVTILAITGSGTLGLSIAAGTASDLAGNTAAAAGPSPTLLVAPVLSNLTISSGTLSPAFASTVTGYNATVSNATSSIIVTPTTTDPNAKVTVDGGSVSAPVSLAEGSNSITIAVTTLDGSATTTYTIAVVRAGQPPNIAYGNGNIVITSAAPFSITPTNTGGAVPKTNYGQVAIYAGSQAESAGYVDSTGTTAQFNFPQQAVMDAAGNLYVADANNNVIRKITPAGVVTTFAGSLTGLSGFIDGTGTGAQFSYPDGITIDGAGNLYVSDYGNNAIRKITPAGVVTTFYSSTVAFGPGGLCIDGLGNLVVAAQDASQIVQITPAGVASVIGGSTPGYVNATGTSAQFSTPSDVKIDASGNLYVADFENNAIRKITPAGVVTTIAGSDVAGNTPGFGDGVATAAVFNNPTGLYVAPGGVIYVADFYNNDIRRVMPDGTVTLVAGSASQVPGDADGIGTAAGFNLPDYVYIDDTGTAYISELGGNRVRKMLLTGYTIKGTLPAGLVFDPTTGVISGNATVPFTAQTVAVTAYNAFGFSTTNVTISYKASSSVATLIDLQISQGTLTPVFASGTLNYTASELNSTTSITVTPTVTDTTATITVNGSVVASGKASGSIPLKVGPNTIITVVTAQDGVTKNTYTVIVTRAPSSDALLSNLTVSDGTLTPAFSSSTMAYADTVSSSATGITLTPTAEDSYATITVNGISVPSGKASGSIPLVTGNNTVTIVVTAQDGTTTATYTVSIYKGEPPADIIPTNVLTPNGDGKNDYWVIKDIEVYPQNNVTVFDRGGRTVYAKRGYTNDWGGTFNGSPLAEGTYYFVVDLGPNLRKIKGYISILRN